MITAGREPQKHIFTVNDLPAFCTSVLSMENGHEEHIRNTPLRIIINSDIQDTLREGKDGVPNPQTKLAWLLNPLRQLHSFQTVHIYDPGSESYKMGITASICSIRPTAKDTMGRLEIACAEGDDAHRNGNLLLALSKFKAGLDIISSGFLDFTVESEVLDGGLFAGLVTSRYVHFSFKNSLMRGDLSRRICFIVFSFFQPCV